MPDKLKELEDRLDRLENRLKATFLEIEKRFEQARTQEPAYLTVDERIQEIEDLLLLIQLEISKVKEGKSAETEFAPTPAAPDINERLNRLEEAVASRETVPHTLVSEAPAEGADETTRKLVWLEERLDRIESKRPKAERKTLHEAIEGSVLEDVRKILEA